MQVFPCMYPVAKFQNHTSLDTQETMQGGHKVARVGRPATDNAKTILGKEHSTMYLMLLSRDCITTVYTERFCPLQNLHYIT